MPQVVRYKALEYRRMFGRVSVLYHILRIGKIWVISAAIMDGIFV